MHSIITWLEHPLFLLYNDHVSVAELLGFITGIWCVYLTVKISIWNFPIGLANNLFFLFIFAEAGLFADSALQVVYIVVTAFGWWAWLKLGPGKTELDVTNSPKALLWGLVGAVAATAIMLPVLRSIHDTAPFWDAATTGLSLSAQTLLSLKKLQNWWLWMMADVIYIPLYVVKGLALTSGVYVVFLALCFAGYKQWRAACPSEEVSYAYA
jgi:nicotinamide mononucleotide transporter